MKIKNISTYIFVAFGIICFSQCTNLDENLYNQIAIKDYYNNKEEVLSSILLPYENSRNWNTSKAGNNTFRMNEYSADQLARPTKGVNGYDGGAWIRLHYHNWTDQEDLIKGTWNSIYTGIGYCNSILEVLNEKTPASMGISEDEKNAYIAEMRAFRAYHYLNLLDIFGNVPIVTQVGTPISPPTETREKLYDFIEKELTETVDLLPKLSQVYGGRMNQAAGYAALADLYLNAEAWIGKPAWDQCISACDKIMSGSTGSQNGSLGLDQDLTTAFSNSNTTTSSENLMVVSFDFQATPDWCKWAELWHYDQDKVYGAAMWGHNATVVIPSAYKEFQDSDLRKSTWMLIGPQYKYGTNEPILGSFEYAGKPIVFVDYIRRASEDTPDKIQTKSDMLSGEENSGVRFNKYQPGALSDAHYFSNDWVIYRLTEIYFTKAEALIRKNGNLATQTAVDLINTCKKRAFKAEDWGIQQYTTATLTIDELLAERGREFIFENKRRRDLIRFNKFISSAWWDHIPLNDKNKLLFPIPSSQLSANSNLKQNPGY